MKSALWLVLVAGVVHADPKAKPPHGAKTISLDYNWQSFSSDEWHGKLEWNGKAYATGKRTVDPKLVDALYASLTNLKDAAEPQRCISHTDDYPDFKIAIDGDEPVTIASDSNCHANVPWNITIGGKLHVQYTADVFRALRPILIATDDRWKKGGDEPIASTGFGYEMIRLGEYEAGKPPKGDAGKCAQSLETNPQAKLVLGDFKVDQLVLGCNLSASSDCSAGTSGAQVQWLGMSAELEMPCTGGQISFPAELNKSLSELRNFATSKPVRALVKLAKSPPRLFNNGAWTVEGDADGAPMLSWDGKSKVIGARAFGETIPVTYWKEIGVDIKPLMKKDNHAGGYYTLDTKLDFTGKVVK